MAKVHRSSRRLLTAVLSAAFLWASTSGCYSRTLHAGPDLSALTRGNRSEELILPGPEGSSARLGPNSSIRFVLGPRRTTSFIPANQLQVNALGVYRNGKPIAPWDGIYGAQVKNLSGGKSFGAVLGAMALAGLVVLLIAGKGKGLKGLGRTMARAAIVVARLGVTLRPVRGIRVIHPMQAPPPGDFVGDGPPPEPHHLGPPPPGPEHLGPPPSEPHHLGPARGAGQRPTEPAPRTWTRPANPGPPIPLFSSSMTRRARLSVLAGVEAGGDFGRDGDATTGFYVGLRLSQAIDIAAGARMGVLKDTRLAGAPRLTQWLAFGRLAGHFDLDESRWISLAIGADGGGGEPSVFVRLLVGLRIRLGVPWLRLGIYPFNVTYTRQRDSDLTWGRDGFTFPTTFDLSFTF